MKDRKEEPLSAALTDSELASAAGGISRVAVQESGALPRETGSLSATVSPRERPVLITPFWLRNPDRDLGTVELGGTEPDGFDLNPDGRRREK